MMPDADGERGYIREETCDLWAMVQKSETLQSEATNHAVIFGIPKENPDPIKIRAKNLWRL